MINVEMTPSTSKGDEKNVSGNRQRKGEKPQLDHADFIEYMIVKNLELWEDLKTVFRAMGRFENSTRDFQCIDESDETPSSLKKRRIDRNIDNPDKEPLPTKRRKGGSSVSETSKKCNEFEKGTATNKSKVAHSKNGVTPQDRHAAHKEKYRGGNSESERNPDKDSRLKKNDKTIKGSSSTLDISPPTIGCNNHKEQIPAVDVVSGSVDAIDPVDLLEAGPSTAADEVASEVVVMGDLVDKENKSKVAHNKNGVTPQDRHAAHKEKYRGGNSESERNPDKDTRLKKNDKTSKGSRSTLDISLAIWGTNQKEQKELSKHKKVIKETIILLHGFILGVGKPATVDDLQEVGKQLIPSVNKVTEILSEMNKQNTPPIYQPTAYIEDCEKILDIFNTIKFRRGDPSMQQMIPKVREILQDFAATNKSKVAHSKNGVTPQDRHAAHKEKYRGGKDTKILQDFLA